MLQASWPARSPPPARFQLGLNREYSYLWPGPHPDFVAALKHDWAADDGMMVMVHAAQESHSPIAGLIV